MKYWLYKCLQDYVHTGYAWQRGVLAREYQTHVKANGGPRVLELGCGGGSLVTAFNPNVYTGIDVSEERIAAAQADYPGYSFIAAEIADKRIDEKLQEVGFVFCHGVLHHIDDAAVRALIERIRRSAIKPATFVAIEPILPNAWTNPPGYLIAKLDDGKWIRLSKDYRPFFSGCDLRVEKYSFFPRWPMHMEAYIATLK